MHSSPQWRSEGKEPAPLHWTSIDDRLTADVALRRLRHGDYLLYEGDYHNARQLLSALARRIEGLRGRVPRSPSPTDAFRAERNARQQEYEILSHLLVKLDRQYILQLRRAPSVREACLSLWGKSEKDTLVPLKTLAGMLGAWEWYQRGMEVPGLKGKLYPHYGVFSPTRTDYLEVFSEMPSAEGKRIFELGTGTGILSFLLLQRGAESVVATDIDPRAVACARENAQRLGLSDRCQILEKDLFPDGMADWIVTNPPWVPESPKNRMDRAVFDANGYFLKHFLGGLKQHLSPNGRGFLILSNLAELLGLRSTTQLADELKSEGLAVESIHTSAPRHSKLDDASDPLRAIRSQEVTSMYCLKIE